MKKILIAGSSGMIGGIVTRLSLQSPDVEKVICLNRKASGIQHEKYEEIIHSDFEDYSEIMDRIQGVDIAHFCIGVYTGAVPDAQFKIITVDYAKAFADAVKLASPEATFCFLSGQGADLKEKSRVSFARYKGMAENHLMAKSFKGLNIFRPAYIHPVTPRKDPNFTYTLAKWLYPVMKRLYPSGVITSEALGNAMYNAGMEAMNGGIFENQDIKKIV